MRRLFIRLFLVIALLVSAAGQAFAQVARDPYFEFLIARRLEAQGDAAGALAALQRAAAADPKSAEVRAEIASFELRQNHPAQAEESARAALALDEANIEGHRVLGLVYAEYLEGATPRTPKAQTDEFARQAISNLERVVADPASGSDINLHFTLGRLYLRTGSSDKAVQAFMRVVDQNPNSVQARIFLAQAYASARDLDSAIGSLQDVVDDEPRVAGTLAQLQEQAGKFKEAAENYTKALAVQPMSRELKYRRLAVLFVLKEYGRAAEFAAQAQAQHPDDLRFPQLQARALFEGGDRDRAFDVLETTLRAHPTDTTTQFALVGLYKDGGRVPDAERTLRQILMSEPKNADALNYLGYLMADRGQQLEEAIRLIEQALDLDPGNPSYLDSLGWAHFRQGNLDEAEKNLAPAAQQLPKNSVIQSHLGDLFARRGRLEDAIVAWTRALDGDGEDINRAELQKKIADARAKSIR
jgi:tetratricopeptide (TPR) repeat protein